MGRDMRGASVTQDQACPGRVPRMLSCLLLFCRFHLVLVLSRFQGLCSLGDFRVVCMYVCMYVCTYVCMYVCTYVCVYVWLFRVPLRIPYSGPSHTYACTYVCVCMYDAYQQNGLAHECRQNSEPRPPTGDLAAFHCQRGEEVACLMCMTYHTYSYLAEPRASLTGQPCKTGERGSPACQRRIPVYMYICIYIYIVRYILQRPRHFVYIYIGMTDGAG